MSGERPWTLLTHNFATSISPPSSISHRAMDIDVNTYTDSRHKHTHTPTQPTHPWTQCIIALSRSLSLSHTHTHRREEHTHSDMYPCIPQTPIHTTYACHRHRYPSAHTHTFTHKDMQSHNHTHIHQDTHTYRKSEPFHAYPLLILTPHPPHSQDPTCEWVPGALASSGLLAILSSLPMSPCPGCGDARRTDWLEGLRRVNLS